MRKILKLYLVLAPLFFLPSSGFCEKQKTDCLDPRGSLSKLQSEKAGIFVEHLVSEGFTKEAAQLELKKILDNVRKYLANVPNQSSLEARIDDSIKVKT